MSTERLVGHLEPLAHAGDRDRTDRGVGERDGGCRRTASAASPGIGLPCGQVAGSPSSSDELLLDVGRDRVLPAGRLRVHLLPFEADDVDEQALGEAVAAHDRWSRAPGPWW